MKSNRNNNVLILGGPNTGKTHFGGQLYGRLASRDGAYKLLTDSEDLSIFKDFFDKMYSGLSADRTHVATDKDLNLEIYQLITRIIQKLL